MGMNPNQSERIGISMRITIRKNSIIRKTGFSRLSLAVDKNLGCCQKSDNLGYQLTIGFSSEHMISRGYSRDYTVVSLDLITYFKWAYSSL